MVYDISLTLILVVFLIGIIIFVFKVKKRGKKDLQTLINEIENDLIDIKKNLESIKLILKKEEIVTNKKKIKDKHARKRSV